MNRKASKICAGILSVSALTSSLFVTAGAAASDVSDTYSSRAERSIIEQYSYQSYKTLNSVGKKSVSSYSRPTFSINGKSVSTRAIIINGAYYVPFRAAAEALGASYSYNSSSSTGIMTASGLVLSASGGCYVSYANGRTLFSLNPSVVMSDSRLYIPVDTLAKAVGMKYEYKGGALSLDGTYRAILSADKFYREDEVLWLARIIHAESQGEPLLGQIAVGNVVLNRVKSDQFPNTIYSVIFDRKYGVQFSPILNGTIYNTPSYNSTLAAKICLEGFDISDGALYFLQPRLATSSWIPKNRDYAFTIGGHDFYK